MSIRQPFSKEFYQCSMRLKALIDQAKQAQKERDHERYRELLKEYISLLNEQTAEFREFRQVMKLLDPLNAPNDYF